MNKQNLIQKIKDIDTLTPPEKAALLELLNTRKKYGLVWEEKEEAVEEALRSQLHVLQEVPERAILTHNLQEQREEKPQPDNLIYPQEAGQGQLPIFESGPAAANAELKQKTGEAARGEAPNHVLISLSGGKSLAFRRRL